MGEEPNEAAPPTLGLLKRHVARADLKAIAMAASVNEW